MHIQEIMMYRLLYLLVGKMYLMRKFFILVLGLYIKIFILNWFFFFFFFEINLRKMNGFKNILDLQM